MCAIKFICLCAQVHTSPQIIKWKYVYHPTEIGLLNTEIG